MKYCPNPECSYALEYGRPAEFEVEVPACLDCGTPLQFGSAPPAAEAPPATVETGELVDVGAFADPFAAQMALAWLREADVPAVVTDRTGTRMMPGLSGGEIHIRVPAGDARRAAELLDELQHPDAVDEDDLFPEDGPTEGREPD
jgi:hypothetical protein